MKMYSYIDATTNKNGINKIGLEGYYFSRASIVNGSKIIVNVEKRELFASELVNKIRKELMTYDTNEVLKTVKDINEVFNGLKLTSNITGTDSILNLIVPGKYKLLGYSDVNGTRKPISMIFERHGSNYTIYDYGEVSRKIIASYISDN